MAIKWGVTKFHNLVNGACFGSCIEVDVKMKLFLFALIILNFFGNNANSFTKEKVHIRLISVRVVKLKDTEKSEWSAGQFESNEPTLQKLIKVTFYSDRDIRILAKNHGANIFAKVTNCEKHDHETEFKSFALSDFIDAHGYIGVSGGSPSSQMQLRPIQREFHVYLISYLVNLDSDTNRKRIELEKTPKDICFRVAGGDMASSVTFSSNSLLISKLDLKRAFLQSE